MCARGAQHSNAPRTPGGCTRGAHGRPSGHRTLPAPHICSDGGGGGSAFPASRWRILTQSVARALKRQRNRQGACPSHVVGGCGSKQAGRTEPLRERARIAGNRSTHLVLPMARCSIARCCESSRLRKGTGVYGRQLRVGGACAAVGKRRLGAARTRARRQVVRITALPSNTKDHNLRAGVARSKERSSARERENGTAVAVQTEPRHGRGTSNEVRHAQAAPARGRGGGAGAVRDATARRAQGAATVLKWECCTTSIPVNGERSWAGSGLFSRTCDIILTHDFTSTRDIMGQIHDITPLRKL